MNTKKRLLKFGLVAGAVALTGVVALGLSLRTFTRQQAQLQAAVKETDGFLQTRLHTLAVVRTDFGPNAHFDPWRLSTTDPARIIDPYLSNGHVGVSVGADGKVIRWAQAGRYKDGVLITHKLPKSDTNSALPPSSGYRQELDLHTGVVTTHLLQDGEPMTRRVWVERSVATQDTGTADSPPASVRIEDSPGVLPIFASAPAALPFWQGTDIEIEGDPEAQQMVHAAQFYLLSSIAPDESLAPPPLGLLDDRYKGHLFWDGDMWMLPALLPNHPDYARTLTQFRSRTLGQAKRNAAKHGMAGAEYAWESDSDGYEWAPTNFLKERHVDGAVAWAAWNYYAWTGDQAYLRSTVLPILQATAQYWASRAVSDAQGVWHILKVIGPDEDNPVTDDNVYTNALARWNLRTANLVAGLMHLKADPHWETIASHLYLRHSHRFDISSCGDLIDSPAFLHSSRTISLQKQASVVLLAYPLHAISSKAEISRTLDFYAPRTDPYAPAMSDSIHSIIAAQLGRDTQALKLFRSSYRPYMLGPWAVMSEGVTQNRAPFLTGMGGCLQSVLYGFAGLRVFGPGESPTGTKLAQDDGFTLCASPHLPPGWKRLHLTGLRFHGRTLDVTILPHNRIVATKSDNRQ